MRFHGSSSSPCLQINWALTEHSAEDAQKIADAIREKLQTASQQLGHAQALPRLFYAGN